MRYLITGGTGSLGRRLTDFITDNAHDEVIVFSRDEQKQFNMKVHYRNTPNKIHYVLGDIRDFDTFSETIFQYRPEVVIHTAAQKHVQECDANPMQAVKTNIEGTKNVAKACTMGGVKSACLISTDKAVDPTTLYGMTKYIAERIWVNAAKRQDITTFVGVRYGNIINSAGSLIPLYAQIAKSDNPQFPLTNSIMTRFFLPYSGAIALIMQALGKHFQPANTEYAPINVRGIDHGMFYVPEMISARIGDIAEIFSEISDGTIIDNSQIEGEKLHEILLSGYCSADHVINKQDLRTFLNDNGLLS